MKKISLSTNSSRWLVGVGFSVALSASIVLYLISQVHALNLQVERAFDLKSHVAEVLQLTIDAETARRGYGLSGSEQYLAPLVEAQSKLLPTFEKINELSSGLEVNQARLAQLKSAAIARMDHAQRMSERLPSSLNSDVRLALLEEGRRLQSGVRKLVGFVVSDVEGRIQGTQELLEKYTSYLMGFVVASCLVHYSFLVLWWRALAQRARARKQLESTEAIYAAAFDDAAVGMVLIDEAGVIVSANRSYLRTVGQAGSEVAGAHFVDHVMPEFHELVKASTVAVAKQGERLSMCEARFNTSASAVWGRITLSRFSMVDRQVRILAIIYETTREVRQNQELRKYEALIRNASRLAGVDGWALNFSDFSLEVGSAMRALLSISSEGELTFESILKKISHDSRRELIAAVRACRKTGSGFELEVVVVKKEAKPRYLQLLGQAVVEGGVVVGIEGAVRDVTLLNEQHRAIARNEARLRAIARVSNDVIWELDVDEKRLWHNQAKGMKGEAFAENISITEWLDAIHPEDRESLVTAFKAASAAGDDTWVHEFRYLSADGCVGFLQAHAAFLRNSQGVVQHIVGGAQDLTRMRRMQSAMMNMAASVADVKDEQFFTVLLRNLIQGLDADGGCIAKISTQHPDIADTLAVVVDGCLLDNFSYPIEGTPCENLLRAQECIVPDNLSQHFPRAVGIGGLNARSYIGGQLVDAQGAVIGFIYLLYRDPIVPSDYMASVIQVFAVRAAAEIRRIEADVILREQADLLDHAREAIVVMDLNLCVRFWNRGAEQMYGWSKEQAVGRPVLELYEDQQALMSAFNNVIHAEQVNEEFHKINKADGSIFLVEESWTLIRGDDSKPQSILKVGSDITEKRVAEDQIKRLAYFDSLTSLPNRRLFMERLSQARSDGAKQERYAALIFIDLDNFKVLNDLHGHLLGDEFLVAVAALLVKSVRRGDTVARLGGDEFVIVLEGLDGVESSAISQASHVAKLVLAEFSQPIQLGSISVQGTASIGVTIFMDENCHLDELLRQADVAMYEAKDSGRNTFCVFDETLETVSSGKSELTAGLKRALDDEQFELWYQAQFDRAGNVYGTEALLRWRHPVKGMISPAEFIPLAERSGFIVELGRWVVQRACQQLADWAEMPLMKHLKVSINVSIQQLRQEDFVSHIVSVLAATKASPALLVLEVTESILDEKVSGIAAKLESLRALGVRISLDDFGTGFSSLSRLRQMPFDEIKIDQSFVFDVPGDVDDAAIVVAIITLGQTMRMRVVAEGVETAEQLQFLKEHGCCAFQGYHFARPMPAEALLIELGGQP